MLKKVLVARKAGDGGLLLCHPRTFKLEPWYNISPRRTEKVEEYVQGLLSGHSVGCGMGSGKVHQAT